MRLPAAVAAWLVATTALPSAAQVEIAADARRRDFAAVQPAPATLERRVVAEQELVLWLPEDFAEGARTSQFCTFVDDSLEASVVVSRGPVEPGLSLVHVWRLTAEELSESGFLEEVASLRMLEVAGRPALEAVAQTLIEGRPRSSRLIISLDPTGGFVRRLAVHCPRDRGDLADGLLQALLHGWWPLDGGTWSVSFEALRKAVAATSDEAAPVVAWSERNALFAAIAEPAALAAPGVGDELRRLTDGRPEALLDGLLHHHPRVRSECLAATVATLGSGDVRNRTLALALTDPDPVLRAEAALAAADHGDVEEILGHLLRRDLKASRLGVFQLVTLLDDDRRLQLVRRAFAARDQYPKTVHPLLACLLGHWGDAAGLADLALARRRTPDASLATAALGELLANGHEAGLEHARRRLANPAGDDPLSVSAAVDHLLRATRPDPSPHDLRSLADGLEGAGDQAEDEAAGAVWRSAADQLRGLAGHLAAAPPEGAEDAECRLLESVVADDEQPRWARQRRAGIGCAEPPQLNAVLTLEVPRPGELVSRLRDLLDRLRLADDESHQLYRRVTALMLEAVDKGLPDPLSSLSSGLAMDEPWQVLGLTAAGRGVDLLDDDLKLSPILPCHDPARLVAALSRSAGTSFALHELLENGFMVTAAVPFLPAMMAVIWDDERELVAGEDDHGPKEAVELLTALAVSDRTGVGADWNLIQLELFRDQLPRWSTEFTARVDGRHVTLSPALAAVAPAPVGDQRDRGAGDLFVDLDLATLAATAGDLELGRELLGAAARLEAALVVDGAELATTLSVADIREPWSRLLVATTPLELRAPTTVVPATTLGWAGVTVEPAVLKRVMAADPGPWAEVLGSVDAASLLELAPSLGPELGLAIVAVPALDAAGDDPWGDQVVAYASVVESAGRRFLKRAFAGKEKVDGRVLYRQGRVWADVVDGFLVVSSNPTLLAGLAHGPRLADSELFREVVERSPNRAALLAGLSADVFADSLTTMIADRPDNGMTRVALEFLRAFGPIVMSGTTDGDAISGRVSLRPNLASEPPPAATSPGRGYMAGSIVVDRLDPWPADALLTELTLELVSTQPLPGLSEATPRLTVAVHGPLQATLVSRSAEPLPERSHLALPINGPDLAPYLRAEPGLALDDHRLHELAAEIRGDETDPAKLVRAVVAWVADNLEYRSRAGTEHAERTLESRQADCTEYSNLVVALCRTLGIPARPVGGASLGSEVAILHRWVEVYLDRWYEVEPTGGLTRVPASSLRLPWPLAWAMANDPDLRLVVTRARLAGDGLVHRLTAAPGAAATRRVALAVGDADTVVVAERGDGTGDRLLLSRDRGETFSDLAPPADVDFTELVGGHARVLWHGRDDHGGHQLLALAPSGHWQPLSLPAELAQVATWSLSASDDGYLAVTGGTAPAAWVFDPDLQRGRPVPPPPAGASWLLARDRPVLAVAEPAAGVRLLALVDDRWEVAVEFSDDDGLELTALRATGRAVEVVCRDQRRDRDAVLWWSSQSGKSGRAAPGFAIVAQDAADSAGWVWRAADNGSGLTFSRWPVALLDPPGSGHERSGAGRSADDDAGGNSRDAADPGAAADGVTD